MEEMIKSCAICGKTFLSRSVNAKFCSQYCKDVNKAEMTKKHNAIRVAEKKKKRLENPNLCKICGKPITAPRLRRYCSPECYSKGQSIVFKKCNAECKAIEKKKPRKKASKSIAEICREAKAHGMDYGEYVVWLERNA